MAVIDGVTTGLADQPESNVFVKLSDVSLDIPVFDGSMSIKKAVLQSAFGQTRTFRQRSGQVVRALRHINLDIQLGDRVGLIGPNGAGKTTLLRLLAGSYFPTGGRIQMSGRVTALLNVGIGMDYDETGFDNALSCCLLLGMSRSKALRARDEIIDFAGLGDFINMPVRTYSTGMLLRLSFAIATSVRPDIFLVDEIIGVGDAVFAAKARNRIFEMIEDSRILILASHDDSIISRFCNKVAFLENGAVRYFGPTDEALGTYEKWRVGLVA